MSRKVKLQKKLWEWYKKHPLFHCVILVIGIPLLIIAFFILCAPMIAWKDGIKFVFVEFKNDLLVWWWSEFKGSLKKINIGGNS